MTEKEALQKVGINIRRVRKLRRLTLVQLASMVNMDKSNLIPIEKGRKNVTIGTLVKLANALNVDLNEFVRKVTLDSKI